MVKGHFEIRSWLYCSLQSLSVTEATELVRTAELRAEPSAFSHSHKFIVKKLFRHSSHTVPHLNAVAVCYSSFSSSLSLPLLQETPV